MKSCLFNYFAAALLLLPAGCMAKNNGAPATDINGDLCRTKAAFTKQDVGHFTVKIFEPNHKQNPDIWQGPLCIINKTTKKKCGFDLSLIKGVTISKDGKSIEVGVFSGSNAWDYRIELESCHIRRLN